MSAKTQKLEFIVDLLDRVSGPVGKIQKTLRTLGNASQNAMMQIGTGAAGVWGAVQAYDGLVGPAREVNLAVGEVASLGTSQDALDALTRQALDYSIKYGEAASGFISSSYDIQSAIAGLEGTDLATFTNSSNVLAKATKADAATITNYVGTMYGIFGQQAKAMGKAAWVEQLTGQTATAVQMFKTTGQEMSAAFTSVGANATAAGIDASEQMAVLGTLQATMSGSEAGTKYKAFLAGVGNAQKSLNMKLTDSNGNMLGMVDILTKLKGRFGDTLDVAESDALKKAFGSDEAVSMIKLLMADTNGLAGSIDALGQVTGMDKATEMASHMVDPSQRAAKAIEAIKVAIGSKLLDAVNPALEAFADWSGIITTYLNDSPLLTKWLGYIALGAIGLTAAIGGLAIVAGLAKMIMVGWIVAMGVMKGALWALKAPMLIFKGIMWAVNIAMNANPIGLIVMGIAALIAAVAAAIYWWDELKAAFMDTSWGKALMDVIEWVLGGLDTLMAPIGWVTDTVGGWFGSEDAAAPRSASLDASRQSSVPPGSVTTHIASTVANTSQGGPQVGTVNIHTTKPMDRRALNEMLLMGT